MGHKSTLFLLSIFVKAVRIVIFYSGSSKKLFPKIKFGQIVSLRFTREKPAGQLFHNFFFCFHLNICVSPETRQDHKEQLDSHWMYKLLFPR